MFQWSPVSLVDECKVRLVSSPKGLIAIDFHVGEIPLENGERNDADPVIGETKRQLDAYFAGRLRQFALPLDLRGTAFQLRVWHELERIPYGETRSYLQVAAKLGAEKAVRAVGAANGANPIPIVVPCHRVIGSGGKLVGYGGGLPLKKRLLTLEGCLALGLNW
ncbi:MAG: methylated-DNA--[protein]-cysteine S-methyltransferase [Candidatus Solibacter sp.]